MSSPSPSPSPSSQNESDQGGQRQPSVNMAGVGAVAGGIGGTFVLAGLSQTETAGKLGSKISDVTSSLTAKIAASNLAQKLGNISGKIGDVTSAAGSKIASTIGPLAGIGGGAMNIAKSAQIEDSDMRAYNIAGDIIGATIDIASDVLLATGVGAVIVVFQILGSVIDGAWDPFKNYYNRDLQAMKKGLEESIGEVLQEYGLDWPLEIKPDYFNLDKNSPDYQEKLQEFISLIQKYYDNNGIIQSEEVLAEEQLLLDILLMKRMKTLYDIDENGNYIPVDPLLSSQNFKENNEQSILKLFALAAYIKSKNLQKVPRESYLVRYLKVNAIALLISLFLFLVISYIIFLKGMNKFVIISLIIICIVVALTFRRRESMTEFSKLLKDEKVIDAVLPQCEKMTPQKLLDAFGGDINKMTDAIVQAGISPESLKKPSLYPQIATFLVTKKLLKC